MDEFQKSIEEFRKYLKNDEINNLLEKNNGMFEFKIRPSIEIETSLGLGNREKFIEYNAKIKRNGNYINFEINKADMNNHMSCINSISDYKIEIDNEGISPSCAKVDIDVIRKKKKALFDIKFYVGQLDKCKKTDLEWGKSNKIYVYTDGSFRNSDNSVSYGVVIIDPNTNNKLDEFKSRIFDKKLSEYRNVSGELLAAIKAFEYASKNGYNELVIFHDYEGVGGWADSKWKAKNELTKSYVSIVQKYRKNIDIKFEKVKGHSGDKWNDYADKLADSAE